MGTRDYFFLGAAIGLIGLSTPTTTEAQSAGRGLRAGNLEFHPSVALEGGYDNNAFLEDDSGISSVTSGGTMLSVNEVPNPTAAFRLSPRLTVTTLGKERLTDESGEYVPPTIALQGGLGGSLYYLPGVTSDNYPWRYEGDLDFDEVILPERTFSLGLSQEGSVRRLPLQSNPGYQWHAGAGARAQIASRGEVLRLVMGYKFGIDRFTAGGSNASIGSYRVSINNFHTHSINQQLTWKFLPKTSLFQDAEFSFRNWADKAGVLVDRFDTARFATRFGANGALSKQWVTTLAVGYGAIFLAKSNNDAETVLGQAKITWRPTETFQSSLGYGRNITPALLGNTSVTNQFELGMKATIAGKAIIGLNSALRFVDFGFDSKQDAIITPTLAQAVENAYGYSATPERSDVILDVDLTGEYKLVDWLSITAEVRYLQNFTDYAFLLTKDAGGMDILVSPAAFSDVQAFAGLRAAL